MLVGYARVSTQEQDLALQLDALRAAGCDKVYEEKASGSQRERPALQAAPNYMRQGDALVVWKLDRLARSIKQLIETVEDLGNRGIGFRSMSEAIDTTTSGGKLVFHLFAALAEFECGVIRERTLAGLQAVRARGRTGGRPPALSVKDVAAAKALLRDPKITVAEVARRLGVVPSTLYRYLPRARTAALEAQPRVDLPPESGGMRSERHAAAGMAITPMLALASAGVR
jgi:DNA invertase Pin-like site-specific DNA recombinase